MFKQIQNQETHINHFVSSIRQSIQWFTFLNCVILFHIYISVYFLLHFAVQFPARRLPTPHSTLPTKHTRDSKTQLKTATLSLYERSLYCTGKGGCKIYCVSVRETQLKLCFTDTSSARARLLTSLTLVHNASFLGVVSAHTTLSVLIAQHNTLPLATATNNGIYFIDPVPTGGTTALVRAAHSTTT